MSCKRCGNLQWNGQYPYCNQCVTCRTCKGSRLIPKGQDLEPCTNCNGIGWIRSKQPSDIRTPKLAAAATIAEYKLPVTVNFQFLDEPVRPFDIKGAAGDLKKQPFLATITYAGTASDGCVGGTEDLKDSKGNNVGPCRIYIPVEAMEKRITELIGKAVFAADTLDTHEGSVEVGQFSDSYMERIRGTEIHVVRASGFFDKRDNAELIAKIIDRARSGELGFSYDLKDGGGYIDAEMSPGENIYVLTDFKWRGATVLRRESAAYYFTNLAAKRAVKAAASAAQADSAKTNNNQSGRGSTDGTGDGKPLGDFEMTPQELAVVFAEANKPLAANIDKIVAGQDAMAKRIEVLEAALKAAGTGGAAAAAAKEMTTAEMITAAATAAADALAAKLPDALKAAGVGTAAKADANKGKRLSLSAAELATAKRWGGDSAVDTDGNTTVEALTAAINAVTDNETLSKDGKIRALDILVPMHNALQREAMGVN